MSTTISCPGCTRKLTLPDHALGKSVRCPACSSTFLAEDTPPPQAITLSRPPAEPASIPYAQEVREPWEGLEASPAARPTRARSARRWLLLAAGLTLVGFMVLGASAVGVLWLCAPRKGRPTPPVLAQDRPEKLREQVKQAFAGPPPAAPAPEEPQLRAVFQEWSDAFKAKDLERIQALFDLDRLVDEVAAQGAATLLRDRNLRREFRNKVGENMIRSALPDAPLHIWTSLEIRSVTPRGDQEVVVITRQRCALDSELKMRWWLTRASGAWKIYDLEDLDVGIRITAGMAALVQAGPRRTREIEALHQLLSQAKKALAEGKLDEGDAAVRRALKMKLPAAHESMFSWLQGMIYLEREDPQQALDWFDRAGRLNANMLSLDLYRGVAFNQLRKSDRALKALQAYRAVLGDDEVVCFQLGEAYRKKSQFTLAAASYRMALDFNPRHLNAFLGLNYSLGEGDPRDDIPKRFERLPDRAKAFEICIEDLQKAGYLDSVAQLAEAMHRLEPKSALASYHLSLARARTGHWQQAGSLLRDSLAQEKDAAKRTERLAGFLQAAVQLGKPEEAYAAAPQPRDAFAMLADQLLRTYSTHHLRAIAALHGKKAPDDPLLPFCRATVLLREGKHREADQAFTAAMAHPPADGWLPRFHSDRVQARFHSSKPLSAYQDILPRDRTFLELARLLLSSGQQDLLENLLTEHERRYPSDPEVLHYRLLLHIRQDRVDDALTLFRTALKGPLKKEQRGALVDDFLQEMASAGRAVEAYRAAPDPVHAFDVLAAALTDDEDREYDAEGIEGLITAHKRFEANDKDVENSRRLRFSEGELLVHHKKWHAAVEKFDPWWKDASQELQDRFRYSFITALYHDDFVRHAYDNVTPQKQTFAQLAHLLLEDHKAAELEELIAIHRPNAPDDPEVDCYAARARVQLNQVAEGLKLLADACAKQPNEAIRHGYVRQLSLDLLAVRSPLEAYRSLPDRSVAFGGLADRLLSQKKTADLKALLDEHGRAAPKDPNLLYYSGELALLQGEPSRAEKLLSQALAAAPPDRSWQPRFALVRAQVRAGTVRAACDHSGWSLESFQSLATQCVQEKDARQLQELVAAFRHKHPDEPSLPVWDLEVFWLGHDYERVLKLVAENEDGLFHQLRYSWKADDYRVRSLVRLKRTREAVETAEGLLRIGRGSLLLAVLAHAADGGARDAIIAMQQAARRRLSPTSCYQDPDLGPLLRSPAFEAFRKKYPEPTEKP